MRTAENMLHLLADLNRQGITVLMTTHDLNAAAAHVPWVVCLNRRVVAGVTLLVALAIFFCTSNSCL